MTERGEAGDARDESLARRKDATHVELDGELVVYVDGAIHHLDPIAALIWNALDGVVTLRELIDDLAAIYPDTPREKIAEDVSRCVDAFRDQGLIEV